MGVWVFADIACALPCVGSPTELEPACPLAPESRHVAAGEDVCLELEMAVEAGDVVWHKGSERIQPDGRFEVVSRGRQQKLVIKGFRAEDQGQYSCSPASSPTPTASTSFQGASSSSGPSSALS